MRKIERIVYTFDELSDNVKKQVLDKVRDDKWICMDLFNEYCIETINNAGFSGKIDLQYSLSYSQGDGLSFSCDYFDSEKFQEIFEDIVGKDRILLLNCIANNTEFTLKGNEGRYCYATKNQLEFKDNFYKNYPNIELIICKVCDKLQDLYIDICQKLEEYGYNEIKYQLSDEYLSDYLNDGFMEFYEDGTLV